MTQAASMLAGQVERPPRWVWGALFVSLAANLVVVGLVVGAVWRFREPPWPNATPSLVGYASALPAERRRQLWDETAAERGHLRPLRRAVRLARDASANALGAEPYDRQQFLAAQDHQAEAETRARRAMQDLYLKIADGLTPEERHEFARWREHHHLPTHNLLDVPERKSNDAESAAAPR
jgi:uncharacterized membrane protein